MYILYVIKFILCSLSGATSNSVRHNLKTSHCWELMVIVVLPRNGGSRVRGVARKYANYCLWSVGEPIVLGTHILWHLHMYIYIWVWVNTYRYIFSGMNIHKSQLFWCSPGVPGFWPTAIYQHIFVFARFSATLFEHWVPHSIPWFKSGVKYWDNEGSIPNFMGTWRVYNVRPPFENAKLGFT